ncbi:hypothetical protein MT418_005384 [Batrachochytrium dendrobatidis]
MIIYLQFSNTNTIIIILWPCQPNFKKQYNISAMEICSMSAALFFDFGDTPHVFQPLRKLYQEKRLEFLSLSDQDILELKLRGKL